MPKAQRDLLFVSFTLQGYYGIGSVCMEPMTDVWEDSLAR